MSDYDNNEDYFVPYHWLIKETDFFYSGVMYFGYLKLISKIITKLNCEGKSHLDVGCGDGKATSYFSKENKLQSKGIDISSRAIAFANLMDDGENIEFAQENLFDLSGTFDLVTSVEVLEHIEINMLDQFICKIFELVKDSGYFICSVPSKNIPICLHRGHIQHFNSEQISMLLKKAGFNKIETIYQHNMKYSMFNTKSILYRIFYSTIKNRFYSINSFEGVLSRCYYKKWNLCECEEYAGRIICIAHK